MSNKLTGGADTAGPEPQTTPSRRALGYFYVEHESHLLACSNACLGPTPRDANTEGLLQRPGFL